MKRLEDAQKKKEEKERRKEEERAKKRVAEEEKLRQETEKERLVQFNFKISILILISRMEREAQEARRQEELALEQQRRQEHALRLLKEQHLKNRVKPWSQSSMPQASLADIQAQERERKLVRFFGVFNVRVDEFIGTCFRYNSGKWCNFWQWQAVIRLIRLRTRLSRI